MAKQANDDKTKGSRLRCLSLTGMDRDKVAQTLTDLAKPFGVVTSDAIWMPQGPNNARESRLNDAGKFLSATDRATLRNWWLKHKRGANVPNWDIVSECQIGKQNGLMLVEAKAHVHELSEAMKSLADDAKQNSMDNHDQIRRAVVEANRGLEAATKTAGWALSIDGHYQLANRFAWAWKIASLGTPVVLVYLGFLNALDMENGRGNLFPTHDEWTRCVHDHADKVVPADAWEKPIYVGPARTPMYATIRSLELTFMSSG